MVDKTITESKKLNLKIGIKSDPIEHRYSFDWLFDLMEEENVFYLQLGSFTEFYLLDDSFFVKLREKAKVRNIKISSVFPSNRELGGFMNNEPELMDCTKKIYKRLIEIAEIVGSPSVGSVMGGVFRDQLYYREKGINAYIEGIKEIMHEAREHGLEWITIEPMSCYAEPPCNSKEMVEVVSKLVEYHKKYPEETVNFGICADISHGWVNEKRKVMENNIDYFIAAIPFMYEFHFKNTDRIYHKTFGFEQKNIKKGIINVNEVREILLNNQDRLPVNNIIGYLELPGPKIGRDYTDSLLNGMIRESLRHLKIEFLKEKVE